MKKLLLILLLLPVSLTASAFSPQEWKASLDENIKAQAVQSLKDSFNTEVKIGRIGGMIAGQIKFFDVEVPGLGQIKQVDLNFNPLKYLYYKQDIMPAITSIKIIDGDLAVSRGQDGNWNFNSFAPAAAATEETAPTINAKIWLKNCRVEYTDEIGWRESRTGFSETINGINGYVAFQQNNRLKFALSGLVNRQKARADGSVDLTAGEYQIDLKAAGLDLDKSAGIPLTDVAGTLRITERGLEFNATQSSWQGIPFSFSGSLNNYAQPKIVGTITAASAPYLNSTLIGRIDISYFKGLLNCRSKNFQAFNGRLDSELTLDLTSATPYIILKSKLTRVDLAALAQKAPGVKGLASGQASIAGPLGQIEGLIIADLKGGELLGQPIEQLISSFTVADEGIMIESFSASSKNASVEASGTISNLLDFDFQAKAKGIKLAGQGAFGRMTALVKDFEGGIDFRLNDNFWRAPLRNLSATGKVVLGEGEIGPQFFDQASGEVKIGGGLVSVKNATISQNNSTLKVEGEIGPGQTKDLIVNGKNIDLNDFKLFSKYGRLNGLLSINLTARGSLASPEIAAGFWAKDISFNRLSFSEVTGNLSYLNGELSVKEPIKLSRDKSQFSLTGSLNLAKSTLNLDLGIEGSDLSTLVGLGGQIREEFRRRIVPTRSGETIKLDLSRQLFPLSFDYSQAEMIRYYSEDEKMETFFPSWQKFLKNTAPPNEIGLESNFSGYVAGRLTLQGEFTNLSGQFVGEASNGKFRDYDFEKLTTDLAYKKGLIGINKLVLQKGAGELRANGDIGTDGTLDLQLQAAQMPLDLLKTLFNKDFSGKVDLAASVEGTIEDPQYSGTITGSDLAITGLHFDQISARLRKQKRTVYVDELSLADGNDLSSINGTVNLSAPRTVSLQAKMSNNGLGLLNLFMKEVAWKKGSGSALVSVGGTLDDLELNGKVDLRNAAVYVKPINSEISGLSGHGEFKDSILTTTGLTGNWHGFLGCAGTVDLRRLTAQKSARIDLDLIFSPTEISAHLPYLFSGSVGLKEARLSGPFYFDLSAGPTLKGKADVNNALLTLSSKPRENNNPVPLNLDLLVTLDKNVYAAMGEVTTMTLSDLFLNLQIKGEDLEIHGSLANPTLYGDVYLKRGQVSIFNREFSLLSAEEQKKYYGLNTELIKENVAAFRGGEGEDGAKPEITIIAKSEVENINQAADGTQIKRNVIILSRITGLLGATDPSRGLNTTFASFVEDKSQTTSVITPGNYSDPEIKVMLLPNFIKVLTGVSQTGKTEVDSNAVVSDYVSSRVQTFVFRGLERDLEQRLGLENLTLEYNFGKDIRKAMGVTETSKAQEERPDWKVGFAKGLFDKWYVEVNYSSFNSETARNEEILNYKLTYKLNPIWAIIYYREPPSLQKIIAGYQKVTLQAGLLF